MLQNVGVHSLRFQSTPPRGGRPVPLSMVPTRMGFQSTPPARGATWQRGKTGRKGYISIHAPREGGDAALPSSLRFAILISIHAPREGGDGD